MDPWAHPRLSVKSSWDLYAQGFRRPNGRANVIAQRALKCQAISEVVFLDIVRGVGRLEPKYLRSVMWRDPAVRSGPECTEVRKLEDTKIRVSVS